MLTHAQASRAMLRDRILDAVGELLGERRWEEVTMADVATAAGVSRQTLYNGFGSRDELAQAYVMREAAGFLAAVARTIEANAGDPRRALAAALETFLAAAATHPLVRAIRTGDGADDSLLPLVTTRGRPVLDQVGGPLARVLAETWPAVKPADAAQLAELLVRLAISHAALPSASPAETARAIARALGPRVAELLAPV